MDKGRLEHIEEVERALQAFLDAKAPPKAQRIVQRLIERNPEADQEAIVEALTAQAEIDPQLQAEFLSMFVDAAYLLAKKRVEGKPLTKEEQRLWKKLM
jgi:cytidylate kinase